MIYYWESEKSYGKFSADNDKMALKTRPPEANIVYREDQESKDGLPFMIIYCDKEQLESA